MNDADLVATAQEILELHYQGRDAEAVGRARETVASYPQAVGVWGLMGLALLAQGRFEEGWRGFEIRRDCLFSPLRKLSYPEWTGAPLAGRSILVCGEQGIGDEIMFARFVPALRELGAGRITLACRGVNVRAFEQLGADLVIPRDAPVFEAPKHDFWVMLGSLPHRLGVTLEHLSGAPYLAAPHARPQGIGLVERGNPDHRNDATRSLPTGSLQRIVPDGRVLEPAGDALQSLQTLAGLEILITVDTSWAHMAGALGVPCWLLLPTYQQDWRWLRKRSDSPWYRSIRLYRQERRGDWTGVFEAIRADLTREVAYMVRKPAGGA